MAENIKSIALALSGGGIRAMIFHMGVIKYLAERDCLEHVRRISTVSGGSLVAGMIFKESDMKWPSSEHYLKTAYPALRKKLSKRNMQRRALLKLLNPFNLKYAFSRANLLSLELRKGWAITENLSDLPAEPEWSINGTTAENGKRFRFKRDTLGDYVLGYASSIDFPLSDAMAVSAAFPGGIGPLALDAKSLSWKKKLTWDSDDEPTIVEPPFEKLHLYDGGVYDNLGLEPFFDAGKGEPKQVADIIIASDAGSPLKHGFNFTSLNPWRLKRVLDMVSDQSRALRVRTFVNYLRNNKEKGAYLFIDTPTISDNDHKSKKFASSFPTTLRKVTEKEFDALANHGYKVAEVTENEFGLGC